MMEKLNAYAMVALVVTAAVSSILRLLGLGDKGWAKTVMTVCFDVGGLIKALTGTKSDETPVPPAAK